MSIHPYAWHNSALVETGALRVSPLQTGLLTGWGLFSTLRIYGGIPFALESHWDRMVRDAAVLRVDTVGLWAELRAGMSALIERNQAQEAVARVYLIRNRGGLLDTPQDRDTDMLLFTRPLRQWNATAKLSLRAHGRDAAAPLAGTKTLAWAHNLVLVEEANAAGFDDVVLLNQNGEVAECTAANIFVVRHGAVLTPPLSSGALPGVSRKYLMEGAARHGRPILERPVREADLLLAEEVFITSTTREVQPVAMIDNRAIPVGPNSERAAAILREEIEAYLATRKP